MMSSKVTIVLGVMMSLAVISAHAFSMTDKLNSMVYKFMQSHTDGKGNRRLLKFSWKDCGSSSYPGHVDIISLSPDPLKLPGNITLGFSGKLDTSVVSPIKLSLDVKKKIVFWIKVPCIDNIGSCTYDNVCDMVAHRSCPAAFQKYGIPCKCPYASGTYHLPPSTFYVDDSSVPAFMTDGEYHVTATVSHDSTTIACVYLELSIG